MLEYTAVIRVAVNTDSKQTVEQQLNSVIPPSGDELEWTLAGLTPLKEPEPNPALAAIQYALDDSKHNFDVGSQIRFLELWNEGDFEVIRDCWKNVPDEVFIGADTQFKQGNSHD